MIENITELPKQKRIALIAHDASKPDLLAWVKYNYGTLSEHQLYATGATGRMISAATGLVVYQFKSGPFGGDQQIGAHIAEGDIDFLIYSGIHWNLNPMIRILKLYYAWLFSTTYLPLAIEQPQIF